MYLAYLGVGVLRAVAAHGIKVVGLVPERVDRWSNEARAAAVADRVEELTTAGPAARLVGVVSKGDASW